jgi:phosphoribosyl-AMP cyclohydrolase
MTKRQPTSFDPASLKFNDQGLIPAIAQSHGSGEVLMMAWMNAASIAETLASGRVTYWSRSRARFWRKGETSGHIQHLVEMRLDCDRDCLLLLVEQTGPACHTNRRSCFYTAIRATEHGNAEAEIMPPEAPS